MQRTTTSRRARGAPVGLALALLATAGAAACDPPSPPPLASTPTSPATATSAEPSAAPPLPVPRREGSNIVTAHNGSRLYVASEEHHAIFALDLPLDPTKAPQAVELPGPPAQMVVVGSDLLVTVRSVATETSQQATLGLRGAFPPPITRPPERKKPFDKGTPKADARRGTPAKPLDAQTLRQSRGGLLMRFEAEVQGGLKEKARVELAADAWGLGVTADGKRAVVSSAFANRLSVIDLTTHKRTHELETAREPRGIAISPDGKNAYVSHLVGSDLTKISDLDRSPTISPLAFPPAPSRTFPGAKLSASLAYAPLTSADGTTLFVPRHAIGASGTGAWWGAPTVDALDLRSDKPLAPATEAASPKTWNGKEGELRHATAGWLGLPGQAPPPDDDLVQPRASILRPSKHTLLVASEGADTVRELDTRAEDPAMFPVAAWDTGISYEHFNGYVTEGGAPSGLALSADESTLYVYARSTFDVVAITLDDKTPKRLVDRGWNILFRDVDQTGRVYVRLADDPLPFDATAGRRLFYSARDTVISGGLGCASCHPEGRDDAHVWAEGEFAGEARFVGLAKGVELSQRPPLSSLPEQVPPLRPRQTPFIAGRVRAPGPYGWRGKDKDLLDRLIHGFQLHRAPWQGADADKSAGAHVARVDMIADFARTGLLPPPTLEAPLSEQAVRGQTLFAGKAQCTSCHVPQSEFTNRQVVPLRALPVRTTFSAEPGLALKTPTLRFVANSAPYLHDGSAATLEELLRNNGDRMGKTSNLSEAETADLLTYLRTL